MFQYKLHLESNIYLYSEWYRIQAEIDPDNIEGIDTDNSVLFVGDPSFIGFIEGKEKNE